MSTGQVTDVLILIDVWSWLQSPIEREKINNIVDFLHRIKHQPGWKVYHWHSDKEIDAQVESALQGCNAELTNDNLLVFNNTQGPVTYWYGGFHTNHCLFYNYLGIEKLIQITVPNKRRFFILEDLTAALGPDRQPISAAEIPTIPEPIGDIDHIIWNYRRELIQHVLAPTPSIEPRQLIGYCEREEGWYPMYAPQRGTVVTQAFILCKYCNGAIFHCMGPRTDAVCLECYELEPELRERNQT